MQTSSVGPPLRASIGAFALAAALAVAPAPAEAEPAAAPIPIAYVPPTNPAHQALYETLKQDRVLERMQTLFRIFPMAQPFGFKLAGCDGDIDAWYDPADRTITVCYDYLQEQRRIAPQVPALAGVSADDVVLGTTVEVFLHEAAHALFDVFRVPVLGREEDAADQVAAFLLLQAGDDLAWRTIAGVGFMHMTEAKSERPDAGAFADEHPLAAQRFYNLICLAYGGKPTLFAAAVTAGLLPKERAATCAQDYKQVAYAVAVLLGPHMDQAAAAALRASFASRPPRERRTPR